MFLEYSQSRGQNIQEKGCYVFKDKLLRVHL